jgi:capsular polysaccharide transport system permease protein
MTEHREESSAKETLAEAPEAKKRAAATGKSTDRSSAPRDTAPVGNAQPDAENPPVEWDISEKPATPAEDTKKPAAKGKSPDKVAIARKKARAANENAPADSSERDKGGAAQPGTGAQKRKSVVPTQVSTSGSASEKTGKHFDISLIKSKPMSFVRHLPYIGDVVEGKVAKRQFLRERWLPLLVLALIVSFTIYYGFIATGMYVSESRFAIKGQQSLSTDNILSLLGGTTSDAGTDRAIVSEYILSPDMIFSLDKLLDLRTHFSTSKADFFSRLSSDATLDEFINYWQTIVTVKLDSASGVTTLHTKAFTSELAHAMNSEILRLSEQLINNMNNRALTDSLAQTRHEVKLAENRLAKARQALSSFRNQYQEIDPSATATSRVSLVSQLEAQLSAARVELETIRKFMSEDSHQVQALKGKMSGLEKQIDFEKNRIASSNNPELIQLLERFEELTMEHEFAQQMYVSAITSLETVRVKMENKSSYIEAFQRPTVPDEPTHPERGKRIIISIVVILLSYGILLLLIAGVRDHMGV